MGLDVVGTSQFYASKLLTLGRRKTTTRNVELGPKGLRSQDENV